MAEAASFVRAGPAWPETPIVVSVPHAGRDYPASLLAATRLTRPQLDLLADTDADRLAEPLAARGVTMLVASRARAWIDLNRAPDDLDPGMLAPPPPVQPSRRARSGLGLIPRRIAGAGEIYRQRLPLDEVRRRVAEDHAPWHDAIETALLAARDRFGVAVLIECHSMPPLAGPNPPRIVIGDRFGASAATDYVDAARAVALAHDLPTSLNTPYAGGYALERHGRRREGIHAVQIEFCRSLYLTRDNKAGGPGLTATRRLLDAMIDAMIDVARPVPLAAE